VWRSDGPSLLVALVHRPRYDDWSLPKGKLEPGEHPLINSVREVAEETGSLVEVGRRLISVEYEFSESVKRVHYWAMRHVGGNHTPSKEVDEVRWLPADEASCLLSYDVDRDVLADFARYPAVTTTVLLIRHAKAGKRSAFAGVDQLRPLDKIGRRQARDAVALLTAFGPQRILAADRVRCEQTVEPLATRLALPIVSAPEFSDEAYAEHPQAAVRSLTALLNGPDASVVCSQGVAIPGLLQALEVPRGRHSGPYSCRKGSVWALTWAAGADIKADYYSHPG
jgi:phosphohistidine phosphatase SixA/8-oxo-dGTP pyrophosphatase MutT (NUDIX family)